jgi:hypothetical protein
MVTEGVILGLPKTLHEALDKLATEKEVKELELLIETTLAAMVPSEDNEVVIDFKDNIDLSDWKSGIEEYDQCSKNDLWEHLGLSDKKLPFFRHDLIPTLPSTLGAKKVSYGLIIRQVQPRSCRLGGTN